MRRYCCRELQRQGERSGFQRFALIQPVLHVADEGVHLTVGKELNSDQPDVLIFINHNALPVIQGVSLDIENYCTVSLFFEQTYL